MKLIFSKSPDNETLVKMALGTVAEEFSYTEMVKQLLKKNVFEDTQYKGLTEEEKKRIEEMLTKINGAIAKDAD